MQPIRTALLAYGSSGKDLHAPLISAHKGFRLTGALERGRKKIAVDHTQAKSYASLEEILKDDIDLVVVCSPTHSHYEYAIQSLQAGKHVLVEKAFTVTTAEAEKLDRLAREKELCLTVFHNRRWDSDFLTVQKILKAQRLGKLIDCKISFDRFRPLPGPKLHKEQDMPGAGILYDLGPHIIDQALQLFGMPSAVFADLRITREQSKITDQFDLILYYENLRVQLTAGFFALEPLPAYVLTGRQGTFHKVRCDVQEADLAAGKDPNSADWGSVPDKCSGILYRMDNGKKVSEVIASEKGNYKAFYDALHTAIAGQGEVPVAAHEGLATVWIIEAAIQSDKKKAVVAL